jgi:hypothetical protein
MCRGYWSVAYATSQWSAVVCCWPSQAQLFLVLGPVGAHGQILVRSKTSYAFGNDISFSKRGDPRVGKRAVFAFIICRLSDSHAPHFLLPEYNSCAVKVKKVKLSL